MPTHINFRYERLLTVSSLKSVHFCRPLLQKRLETNLGSLARRCLVWRCLARRCLVLLLKKDALFCCAWRCLVLLLKKMPCLKMSWLKMPYYCCVWRCLVFSWLHEGKVARRRWDDNSHVDRLNHVDRLKHVDRMKHVDRTNHVDRMNPPPRGGFLFTMFPHQEPWVGGPPSKRLVQILGGSSYSRFLMKEYNK